MRPFRFFMIMAIVLVAAVPRPAAAGDAEDIRAVIDGQIAAFRADDGSAAYAFAAPSIRRIFTSPESFMAMVKSGYQPVYRPQSVTYGRMMSEAGQYVQEVFVVGPDGAGYTVLYSVERQADGTLMINGCHIVGRTGSDA